MFKLFGSFFLVWLIGAILWIVNIVKLAFMVSAIHDWSHIPVMFVLRIVGIPFFPLGIVLAFFSN